MITVFYQQMINLHPACMCCNTREQFAVLTIYWIIPFDVKIDFPSKMEIRLDHFTINYLSVKISNDFAHIEL